MYDVIIIGGGPAGFSSAIYTSRYGLKTLLISETLGGQIIESFDVENYPGIKKTTGMELMNTMQEQAKEFGVEIKNEIVTKIENNKTFKINDKYESKTIILAQGMKRRKLNAKNEEEFTSKGVSYCATCDGAFFRDKIVGVVGGNDSAAESALLLTKYAKKVYIIYRKENLRAEKYLVDKINKEEKVEIIPNTNVSEVNGEKLVESVTFDNGKEFKLNGLFIEIGFVADTTLPEQLKIELDKDKLIKVNPDQSTSTKGAFAAGDCTTGSNKFNQIVTAASEGIIAAESVYKFLNN